MNTKQNFQNSAEASNDGNTVLPTVNFEINSNTYQRCLNGHTWTYTSSMLYDLENHPCDCGAVLYHSELCQCCGQRVVKLIPCNDRNKMIYQTKGKTNDKL